MPTVCRLSVAPVLPLVSTPSSKLFQSSSSSFSLFFSFLFSFFIPLQLQPHGMFWRNRTASLQLQSFIKIGTRDKSRVALRLSNISEKFLLSEDRKGWHPSNYTRPWDKIQIRSWHPSNYTRPKRLQDPIKMRDDKLTTIPLWRSVMRQVCCNKYYKVVIFCITFVIVSSVSPSSPSLSFHTSWASVSIDYTFLTNTSYTLEVDRHTWSFQDISTRTKAQERNKRKVNFTSIGILCNRMNQLSYATIFLQLNIDNKHTLITN